MSSTLHRKDMTHADFLILAKFSWLFQQSACDSATLNCGLVCYLGEVSMNLPIWCKSNNDWKLDRFKEFKREAVGIESSALRNMCRYLELKEHVVIDVLFRFSMLSVVAGQKTFEKRRFRMHFFGEVKTSMCVVEPSDGFGFVIERRRLEGAFRTAVLPG